MYTKELHEKLRLEVEKTPGKWVWSESVISLLDEIDRCHKLLEWIPVETRLPELEEKVLVFDYTCKSVFLAFRAEDVVPYSWSWVDNTSDAWLNPPVKITHWRPLPLPPVKEGE